MVLGNSGNEYVPQETAKRLEKAVNFKESRGISNQHWIAHVLYELFWKLNWTEASVTWVTSHEQHGEEKHPQRKPARYKPGTKILHEIRFLNLSYFATQTI